MTAEIHERVFTRSLKDIYTEVDQLNTKLRTRAITHQQHRERCGEITEEVDGIKAAYLNMGLQMDYIILSVRPLRLMCLTGEN